MISQAAVLFSKVRESKAYKITLAFYVLYTLCIALFSVRYGGYINFFTNSSGSMSPTITTGSLIAAAKDNYYSVGDIITFYKAENGKEIIVTHRVVQIGGNVYVTKGDANEGYDRNLVLPRHIIGKVVVIIPYLGYVVSFAKNTIGLILTIWLPAAVIILIETFHIISNMKNNASYKAK